MFNFIKLENEQQFSNFNKKAFKFKQTIIDDPLTSIDKLTQLILRLPPEQVYASSSKVDVTANLDTAHKEHKIQCSLEHALNNLENSDSFVMVRNPEVDEEYRALFKGLGNPPEK